MKDLIKMNLSKYEQEERLPSEIENCILNGLIITENNIQEVAEKFQLSEDTVTLVYAKYAVYLEKICDNTVSENKLNKIIKDTINLYSGHVNKIKEVHKDMPALRDYELKQLNGIMDRVTELKNAQSKNFDSTVNKLTDYLIKIKQLEKLEYGAFEDNSDYIGNVATVSEMLTKFNTGEVKKMKPCWIITADGVRHDFTTVAQMADYFHADPGNFSKWLKKGLYKGQRCGYTGFDEGC